jgi:2-dehydro-3-deoxyphosphogluconate aldolase/(4S)-4-hydroxy-2-oxoglutarate aldolase
MQRIFDRRILPAAVVPNAADAVPLALALLAGGLDVMEVTFRTPDAPRCIELIREKVPQMYIGAGTLLTPGQIDQAIESGAQFGVTPGFNPTVISAAIERSFPLIPGVMTPGEMERAMEYGCSTVKFFPAAAAGGPQFLKAIAAPYLHTNLRIIPLGGVGPHNLREYLAVPLVVAVGGSWLTERRLILDQSWDKITSLAKEALSLAHTSIHDCNA